MATHIKPGWTTGAERRILVDTLEELREDFEDIIDSMIAFEEMDDEDA